MEEKNVVTYESVKDQTTEEYFKDNQFAIDAFNSKYILFEGETYVQAIKRVCDFVASAEETTELKKYWSKRWFDEIYKDWWHPAGSIMQGAASGKNVSLCNCTTISLGSGRDDEEWDNLESIVKNTAYTVAKAAAFRQGIGVDFSRLRPVGTSVKNSASTSSGATHWMKFIDSIGYYVGQFGRVPAMLFSLSCDHPDVEEFIKMKDGNTEMQNANISVHCTEAFYKAVDKDKEWQLTFTIPEVRKGQKVYLDVHSTDKDSLYDEKKKKYYHLARKNRKEEKIIKTVQARYLLELIAKHMSKCAEPGIQNIDIARKYSNSDYVYDPTDEYDSRIISTNACSEQYLSRDALCVLSSANVGTFSVNPKEYELQLQTVGESLVRFLDNVNTMEVVSGTYATPFQKMSIEKLRRVGAGYTNIAGWLFKQGLEYGTPEGNNAIAEFTKRYNYHLYKSSIELGKEKGSFGLFNREKFEASPFVKRMMKLGLEFKTMRNCNCSSIAPTGTLSLMFRNLVLSYGIEPAFGIYFWKRTRIAGHYDYYFCVPAVVREAFKEHGLEIPIASDTIKDTWDGKRGKPIAEFIDNNLEKLGIKFHRSTVVKPMDKLDLMGRVMKHIDSSISVTYMLPENAKWRDVYNFILAAHKKEVKSIAAFPDKKMYGIISYIPFKSLATKLISEGLNIHDQNFTKKEHSQLEEYFGISPHAADRGQISKTKAPIRPHVLQCDIHHIKVTKKLDKVRTFDYLVMVGLLGGDPYEVFVMENGFVPKKNVVGTISKIKSGVYSLRFEEDGFTIDDVTKDATQEEDIFTRLISTSLRHGADILYVVEQLEKSEGDLCCLSKAISRALKKYIKNGTKVNGKCPDCGGNDLMRNEGCIGCSCGWSKCG